MRAPWLLAMIVLSAAPILKIGDVQAVEILQVCWLALAVPAFVHRGMQVPASGVWRRYGAKYAIVLGLAGAVSVAALRLPFYTPPDVSVFKQPLLLSLSRLFEFSLVICFMFVVARAVAANRAIFRIALDTFVGFAVLTASASLASWALLNAGGPASFLVYGYDDRVRGLFNEGGPYGMYLVGAAVASLLRRHLFPPVYPFLHRAALLILAAGLLASGSKAGLLAAVVLCLAGAAVSGSRLRRAALAGACTLILAALLSVFQGKLLGYFYAYLNFDEALANRPDDPSLIMGRLAASVIVPRIIAAHPLAGIGAGNYSLMRNDPNYLEGLPPVDDWDLPGVGLLGSAAELGIPLTAVLLIVLLQPVLRAGKRGSPAVVVAAALFQPVAFLLGVNMNFFYPWLIAAFVISLEERSPQQ